MPTKTPRGAKSAKSPATTTIEIPIVSDRELREEQQLEQLESLDAQFDTSIDGCFFELHRKTPKGVYRYLADVTPPVTLAEVKAEHGGGDYIIVVKDEKHRYLKRYSFGIEGPERLSQPGANPAEIQPKSQAPEGMGSSMVQMLIQQMNNANAQAIAQQNSMTQIMVAMIGANKNAQQIDPLKLAELLSSKRDPTPAEQLVELADLGQRLAGHAPAPAAESGEVGMGGMVVELLRAAPHIGALLDKFKNPPQNSPAQIQPTPRPRPTPPTTAAPASPANVPVTAQSANVDDPPAPIPFPAASELRGKAGSASPVASVEGATPAAATAPGGSNLNDSHPAMAEVISKSKAVPALLQALPEGFDLDGSLRGLAAFMLTIPRNPQRNPLMYAARIVEAFGNAPTAAMLNATQEGELALELLAMFPQLKGYHGFLEDVEVILRDQFQPIDDEDEDDEDEQPGAAA